jgi:hypothetical protein
MFQDFAEYVSAELFPANFERFHGIDGEVMLTNLLSVVANHRQIHTDDHSNLALGTSDLKKDDDRFLAETAENEQLFGMSGSGLIDYSQKMTIAAIQIADINVWAHRS